MYRFEFFILQDEVFCIIVENITAVYYNVTPVWNTQIL